MADHDQRDAAPPAVDRDQVHPVEPHVDRARDPPFDEHPPADEIAHQAADR